MKLDDWLWQNKMRRLAFARALHISPGHVTCIIQGRSRPGTGLKERIAEFTGGAVPVQEWEPDAPHS